MTDKRLLCDRVMQPFVMATLMIGIVTGLVTAADRKAVDKPVAADKPRSATRVSPDHAKKMAKGLAIFKKDVRSILVKKCIECHGKDSIEGEFNLATRKGLLKGGAEGKAIVPGDAKKSRLYRQVAHLEQPHMPYEEKKLSQQEITLIAEWINHFAPYDKPLVTGTVKAVTTDWTQEVVPGKSSTSACTPSSRYLYIAL